MARSDLLLDLVEAERRGDRDRFRVLVEAVIAEERANQHHLLADRLSELITTTGQGKVRDAHAAAVRDLVHEITPERRLADLELESVTRRVLVELVEEQKRAELLRSYGIEPRNRLVLSGPPGNGKTSVAEAIAGELVVPEQDKRLPVTACDYCRIETEQVSPTIVPYADKCLGQRNRGLPPFGLGHMNHIEVMRDFRPQSVHIVVLEGDPAVLFQELSIVRRKRPNQGLRVA